VSAPILRLSASQRPVFLLNSRLGHFTAASFLGRHPFSRSYGVILPSSLTRVIPRALGFSPRLPVSVCGTGAVKINARGFSRQFGTDPVRYSNFPPRHASELPGGFASQGFLNAWTGTNTRPDPPTCVTPSLFTAVQECPPVVHRLRHWPRLSPRLTLSGRALPRKP
jgi:hypothetical protein